MHTLQPRHPGRRSTGDLSLAVRRTVIFLLAGCALLGTASAVLAQASGFGDPYTNNPGLLEPVTLGVMGEEVRVPNTDQSVDGTRQDLIDGAVVYHDAEGYESLVGAVIDQVTSPNDDMRLGLDALLDAALMNDQAGMEGAADELLDILFGRTEGRIYDGFPMLNIRVDSGPTADHMPGEYKMKMARDSGRTYTSPWDGEERRIYEVDISMLYYDGQIDSDTFLLRFPVEHHEDDVLHVNYRIFSLVQEDFSPTLVMLDKRWAQNTVQFPFKGMDSVWVAFDPGQVVELTVKYPTVRQIRGVYTWGWREHPPRIQFLQPVYEIVNAHTGEVELDPQGASFAYRNRTEMTVDKIAPAAPEKKMYEMAMMVQGGASPVEVALAMLEYDDGPRGTSAQWADLVKHQTQLPDEAWDVLREDHGLERGDYGDFSMISVFMNNEMYGEGPFLNEITTWNQGDTVQAKLINFDQHTHYFRNVDFGARLNDDILRCCGGGLTSFEIMNFKPSYGAPKVAEMQWRAGWGFRPHYDVIQQYDVFPRAIDRSQLTPYTSGDGGLYFGYKYSAEHRNGDFAFNPPPFIITDITHPAENPLRDANGETGLIIGQFTEGYGTGQFCPQDPYPGFCQDDIAAFNPNGVVNFPPPPLRGQPVFESDLGKFPGDVYPDEAVELRYPPFLRNPAQTQEGAGDIIPPTGAWRPFLWYHPQNGTLYNDPDDPSKGFWADETMSHGAPVFSNDSIVATIELPRSSGQVFYQFDDLFHDNAIFSPHPVFTAFDERDEEDTIEGLFAGVRGSGDLHVRGEVSTLENGEHSAWVAVFAGAEGEAGCTGTLLGSTQVRPNGRWVFRAAGTSLEAGDAVCARTSVGATSQVTVID